jgi:hypothetical protein
MEVIKPGSYVGQCSELCGPGHGFMPIQVTALTPDDFSDHCMAKMISNNDIHFYSDVDAKTPWELIIDEELVWKLREMKELEYDDTVWERISEDLRELRRSLVEEDLWDLATDDTVWGLEQIAK